MHSETFPLSTELPLSFFGLHGGNNAPAATSGDQDRETDTFEHWLFTEARTELGPIPDWPYLRDYAQRLQSGRDVICLKRRQILVSWITAAWMHWTASRNPYHHCAVVSAEGRAARKQGRRIVIIARNDGWDVQGVELITYPNGSEITILPSTEHAGVGESLAGVMHYDEFAFHPYGSENMATIQPAVSNSGGQTVVTSTANPQMGMAGAFFALWESADDDMRLFYGRDVRPDQDAEWMARERKRYATVAEFNAYYPENPTDAFEAHAGLVYGADADGIDIFSRIQSVKPAPFALADAKWRVYAVGPGGTDPTGTLVVGISHDERWHVFRERREPGTPSFLTIRDWLNQTPGGVTCGWADGEAAVGALRGSGLFETYAAIKDRQAGIAQVQMLLRERRLTVDPSCEKLIHEFSTYWHDEPGDNTLRQTALSTKTPRKLHHAELLDCLRYIVMGVLDAMPRARKDLREARGSLAIAIR